MSSLWNENVKLPRFESLKGDKKVDVLIIGGGIAGILCAYMLKEAGVECILIEKDRICQKTTANTTAKITAQHGFVYQKIIKQYGKSAALLYLKANNEALEAYKKLCKDIDCDFQIKDNYVYSLDSKKIENELNALQSIGYNSVYLKDLPLPIKTAGAVGFKNQAQFHPLKFISAVAENLNIYENTKALEFLPKAVKTDKGIITAEKIIVATHFPILNKHGLYFLKMYQHRSYVTALSGATQLNGMYVDEDKTGFSFRNEGDFLLLGGGGHRTGKNNSNIKDLMSLAKKSYPDCKKVYEWAAQDCMTLDGMAYIGQYSKNTKGLYVATGFNKWGMTSSMVAARLLADLITDKDNPYKELFSPSRSILHPQLAVNTAESFVNLVTPTKKRCPHLGCALKYNKYEHSYDCSCHGSRFSENGELLDGPASDGIKKA